ncbi:MAG: TonB-dependent receptor [Kordiimonadales bacterium]|nr:MAG: TonB-dependent receptor [Kordiimonadales bacterium]
MWRANNERAAVFSDMQCCESVEMFRLKSKKSYTTALRVLLASTALCTAWVPVASAAEDASTRESTIPYTAPPAERDFEEIVVSGAFEGRKLSETILGGTILRQEDLARQLAGSLGETLKRQPGISSTFFGPGASRPIIRGLGGDRIRILDFGLGSIDASSTSPDHAVAIEPALAKRIEILRGSALLVYGSSAAGGAINVFDGRIPTKVPEGGFDGAVRYGHNTGDDGDEFSGAFNAELAKIGDSSILFHGDISYRDTDDYSIPGFARSAQLRASDPLADPADEPRDIVANSATETLSGSAGLSAVFDNGFFGANVRALDSEYGVPGSGEEGVTIDIEQTRFDLHGELEGNFGLFKKAKFRFGYADYLQLEIEDGAVGTVFSNEGFEGRLDFVEKGGDNWNGSTGIQVRSRDFSAVGEEAFVPPTLTTQIGIYTVKELSTDSWKFEFGGRFEYTKHTSDTLGITRSFNGVSLSAGAGYNLSDNSFFGVSISRTERAPSTEEIFSNGPHLATEAFEIGDLSLGLETAIGIEATFNYSDEIYSFIANVFLTSYDDFVFEVETGATLDDLAVFQFNAGDAQFYGFETKAEFQLGASSSEFWGELDYSFDAQLDYVRATLRNVSGNNALPRIPPLSALIGISAIGTKFDLRTELEYSAGQNRATDFETTSDAYWLWNTYFTLHPFENRGLSLEVRATNLTNTTARQHTSFLKDVVPLPGRTFKISLRAEF